MPKKGIKPRAEGQSVARYDITTINKSGNETKNTVRAKARASASAKATA